MRRRPLFITVLVIAFGFALAACGSDGEDDNPLGALRVPEDHETIQAAVDAAEPGDLILIGAGTYNEAVVVETDEVVIRGVDRNEVILDGQQELENGFKIFSNGVAIENLTTRNFTSNGVFFTGDYDSDVILTGYRISYVTAHNNGNYGLYAFNAQDGLIEHSYGSGQPDSAVYIGQCQPCNAVVTDVVAENNALGYSGTNAGGELYVINSEWRNNRIGIVPNSQNSEELAPQRNAVFAGNYVHDNGNEATPLKSGFWDLAFGVGIVIAGGENDDIIKNRVDNNVRAGIAVSSFPAGQDDEGLFDPVDNRVIGNVALGNGEADLVYLPLGEGAVNNCFADNEFEISGPADIESVLPCEGEQGQPALEFAPGNADDYTHIEHTEVPLPPAQPNMPDAATAPAEPAVNVFVAPDLNAITVPEGS